MASCPYCGSTLNFGINYCVVCGRHASSSQMSKMETCKGGMRLSELTRRLDSALSSHLFTKAKKSYQFLRYVRFISLNFLYLLIIVGLFFCAIRFAVEPIFPGRIGHIIPPLLGQQPQRAIKGQAKGNTAKAQRNHGKKRKLRRILKTDNSQL